MARAAQRQALVASRSIVLWLTARTTARALAWVRGASKHADATGFFAVPIDNVVVDAGTCCDKYNPLVSDSGAYDALWGMERPPPPAIGEGTKNAMAHLGFGLIPGLNTVMGLRDPTAGPWRKAFAVAMDVVSVVTFGMASAASGGVRGGLAGGKVLKALSKGGQGLTVYHGTEVESAVALLNGAELDAAAAAAGKIDGPAGFFGATHIDDAFFFASRRMRGSIVQLDISSDGLRALHDAGAVLRPIPQGARVAPFAGQELFVPTGAFGVFNEARSKGMVLMTPYRF